MISPADDPQRELVYFWENHNFHAQFYGSRMPIREARKMARAMAKLFKLSAPNVRECRRGKDWHTAEQNGREMRVNLDKAHWTPTLLAHEVAHYVYEARGGKGADHGPAWMGIYLRILDKFKILPLVVTVPLARAYGIKFKDPTRCF